MTLDLGTYADCIDGSALVASVTQRLGPAAGTHLDLRFAPGVPPTLEVRVDGEPVWVRPFPVAPADCPVAHEAIALSVQRGVETLATLPWDEEAPDPARPWRLGAALTGSVGMDTPEPRGGLRLRAGYGPPEGSADAIVRVAQGSWFAVGDGDARLAVFGAGLGVQGQLGWTLLAAECTAGLGHATGRDFDTDLRGSAPRVSAALAAGVGRGAWEAAVEAEVVVLRVVAAEPLHGVSIPESAVRIGLRLGGVARL